MIGGLAIAKRDSESKSGNIEILRVTPSMTETKVSEEVIVDVEGEVIKPGVYKLNTGSRIVDALKMSGGLGEKADRDWVEKNINMAERILDGMKIYIPSVNDQLSKSNYQTSTVKGKSVVSLNNATVEELDTLTGIGPAIAKRIIDYREKNNGFKNVEEIKLVSGIGDKLFEKIKDEISL